MKSEITLADGRIVVRLPYSPYSPAMVNRFRALPGARFHGDTKLWSFYADRACLLALCDCLGTLPWMLSDELKNLAGVDPHHAVQRIGLDMSVIEGHHFVTRPFEHQRLGLVELVTNNRWLLAWEMGACKTHVVINRMSRLIELGKSIPKFLVVCPKSVLAVWREQLLEHGNLTCDIIDDTSVKGIARSIALPSAIKVVSYDKLRSKAALFHEVQWDFVVTDELHRCKNFTAATSKAVRKITAKATYVYGLSGTPCPNGLEDWLGVLSVIDPHLLKDDFGNAINTKTAFYARYCIRENLNGIWRITGYRNVAELHKYIALVTSRVTKKECLDLPDKVFSVRRVELEGEQARIYRDLKKDAVARLKPLWDKTIVGRADKTMRAAIGYGITKVSGSALGDSESVLTINNILSESLRLLQVVGGFVPDDEGKVHEIDKKAKLSALADVIEELGEQPLVVWCAFRAEVTFLRTWLTVQYSAKVAWLTGEDDTDTRTQNLEDFKTGKARFFVGTSAAGEGINGLQDRCSTEVFYSRGWNLKDYLQMTDRLHRHGQKNTVNVINLIATGTVDEKVEEALTRKASLQELLLSNPEDVL